MNFKSSKNLQKHPSARISVWNFNVVSQCHRAHLGPFPARRCLPPTSPSTTFTSDVLRSHVVFLNQRVSTRSFEFLLHPLLSREAAGYTFERLLLPVVVPLRDRPRAFRRRQPSLLASSFAGFGCQDDLISLLTLDRDRMRTHKT